MTKKVVWVILIAVVICLIWYWNQPHTLTVETVIAKPGITEATVSNTRAGTITACQRSRLALSIGGQIASISVVEGESVEKGTVLLHLWNEDAQAQLEATQAGLSAADYEKKSLCIQSASDAKEASRQKKLFKQKLVSEEAKDLATTRANASKAACTAANARWKQAKAVVSQAKANLEKTYLVAPFKGTVAEITGEVGEFTTPSPPGVPTPPAIDLITADCHFVKAPIDEVDAGKIRTGMPVRISLDAFRGQAFTGEVRRISPYVQDYAKQARTVDVEVEFLPQELPRLLAGYSVDIEIILATSAQGLRVPTDAIFENSRVYVLNENGVIEEKEITIGLNNWQFTEVLSGIGENELIITSASGQDIMPGARAKAQ